MKRILLYLFLLTYVGMASAQTPIPESGWMTVSIQNNQSAANSLIRARNNNEAITYFENGDTGYFSRIGIGSTIGSVKLEPKYHVLDFRIIDNFIFFRGYYSGYTQYYDSSGVLMTAPYTEGMLGCIDIGDINTSNIGNNNILYQHVKVPDVGRINRMVAYSTPTTSYQVVAIADSLYHVNNGNILYGKQKIISCDIEPLIMGGSCNVNTISTPSGDMGSAHDIVVTNNYVATIGYHHAFGSDNIAIRRCDKNNVNAGELSAVTYYPFTTMENLSYMHACAMEGDNIAVAYGAAGAIDNVYYMRARFINIADFSMFNSQEYDIRYKTEPWEMTYLPDYRCVVLLHDCDDDQCISSFNFLTPNEYNPYTYDRIYPSSGWYSMDRLTDGCYIAAGGNRSFVKSGTMTSANGCYNYDRRNVRIISNVNPMSGTSNLSTMVYPSGTPFNLENVNNSFLLQCSYF